MLIDWSCASGNSRQAASLSQSHISFGHLDMWQSHIEPSQAIMCVVVPRSAQPYALNALCTGLSMEK